MRAREGGGHLVAQVRALAFALQTLDVIGHMTQRIIELVECGDDVDRARARFALVVALVALVGVVGPSVVAGVRGHVEGVEGEERGCVHVRGTARALAPFSGMPNAKCAEGTQGE